MKENFYAIASSDFTKPKYPKCKEFREKSCIGLFQKYEQGKCEDRKTGEIKKLTCCKAMVTRKKLKQSNGGKIKRYVDKEVETHAWVEENRCL